MPSARVALVVLQVLVPPVLAVIAWEVKMEVFVMLILLWWMFIMMNQLVWAASYPYYRY